MREQSAFRSTNTNHSRSGFTEKRGLRCLRKCCHAGLTAFGSKAGKRPRPGIRCAPPNEQDSSLRGSSARDRLRNGPVNLRCFKLVGELSLEDLNEQETHQKLDSVQVAQATRPVQRGVALVAEVVDARRTFRQQLVQLGLIGASNGLDEHFADVVGVARRPSLARRAPAVRGAAAAQARRPLTPQAAIVTKPPDASRGIVVLSGPAFRTLRATRRRSDARRGAAHH